MHGRNNYQMLRKLKRLGIVNARQDINKKLDKLGCRPVFYNENTKRYEVFYCVFHKNEKNLTKQEQENLKKIKAICDSAKIYLNDVLIFQDNITEIDEKQILSYPEYFGKVCE